MIWQASIDRFLQLLWNGFLKIISSNCKVKPKLANNRILVTDFTCSLQILKYLLQSSWKWDVNALLQQRDKCPTDSPQIEMTCAFITTSYPLTVFQSIPAEIQPDKNQLYTYKVHFVKRRKTSSKLCRRNDANIAVQSLFLNRLIVLFPAARTHFQTDRKWRSNF